MTGDSSRCPHPEALAAFVAGKLSGEELSMTANHLLECDDCRAIVREVAYVAREEGEPASVVEVRPRRMAWWLTAAAAAVACVAYLASRVPERRDTDGIRLLVDAAPRDGRYVEPRLTGGFPWAPMRPVFRSTEGALDAGQMKLVGAAGAVLERTGRDESPEAKHAAAIAHLVAGRPDDAATRLTELANATADPRVWSDLAAARYQSALQSEDPSRLPAALAAADAALRLDADLPEALFNRALIVERLGLREPARAAWQRYLTVEPNGEWAREAATRLKKLEPVAEFREELERRYATLQADEAAARELARRFPQDARVWGESEILSRWAHAYHARDDAAAAGHLAVAHAFGAEIAGSTGETMLAGAVAAIERADDTGRQQLAGAHIDFRQAQRHYKAAAYAAAERSFTAAAGQFAESGSPLQWAAAALAANTIFDQHRIADARVRLESLQSRVPRQFEAVHAQLQWEIGLVHVSGGRWGDALAVFKQSMVTFERLREMNHAANVRELVAQAYDRIGDSRTAWEHRHTAMQELGRYGGKRLKITIESAAHTSAVARDWAVSLALLGLQLELAQGAGEEFVTFQTRLLRARIAGQMAQTAIARAELQHAAEAMQQVPEPLRERAAADRFAVEGLLAESSRDAVPLLTSAIEFHKRKGRRMFLPELLLHRGRALSALGDEKSAAADFEQGIVELERQRSSIEEREERWGMFAAADQLFDEALLLSHRRGDQAVAFAYAERARARELLESIGETHPAKLSLAGVDATIVEYVSLPAKLMIFVAGHGGVHVVEENVGRAELQSHADAITHSALAGDRAGFRRTASLLHARLVAPVVRYFGDSGPLVFVPDSTVATIPFAALVDASGRYVVEDHAVVVAPSAAVFARVAAQREREHERGNLRLLVVSGPAIRAGDVVPLSGTGQETEAVAAAYGNAVRLHAKGGNPAVFAQQAAEADVIHFTGHAEAIGAGDAALLTSRGAGDDDRLDVREIARLQLPQTRTVVLAACSTARGQQRAGEGTISVARAFLAAGVPSVVATLWPIEDASSAEFFPRLHHHLARGAEPAEALRAAQLEWIHCHDAPPSLWAAVQVIGS
jgi:CHAT domain-containing protein